MQSGQTDNLGGYMRFVVVASALAIGLVGCAKRPDAIVPVDVPMAAYQNYSCERIAAEIITENETLSTLSVAQHNAATGDAVFVFLIGVPLSSVAGGDKEGKIAVSKGKIQALENVSRAKGCNAVGVTPVSEAPAAAE